LGEAVSIDQILKVKLKPRIDLSGSGWTIWEHKTLNMHRAVLVWEPEPAPRQYAEIPGIVRAKVEACLKSSWWRGLGFGLVAILPSAPEGVEACVDDIDTRQNAKGTWQWSVLSLREQGAVIGAHMWMQGYLSSTYEQLIRSYESEGHKVATFKKEKDKLMQFLSSFARLPEYEDPRSNTEPEN
jgi:hypothetical protein